MSAIRSKLAEMKKSHIDAEVVIQEDVTPMPSEGGEVSHSNTDSEYQYEYKMEIQEVSEHEEEDKSEVIEQ